MAIDGATTNSALFGANGMKEASGAKTITFKEGYYSTSIVVREDAVITGLSVIGDGLSSEAVVAGDVIFLPLKTITLVSGRIWIYANGNADNVITVA